MYNYIKFTNGDLLPIYERVYTPGYIILVEDLYNMFNFDDSIRGRLNAFIYSHPYLKEKLYYCAFNKEGEKTEVTRIDVPSFIYHFNTLFETINSKRFKSFVPKELQYKYNLYKQDLINKTWTYAK